MKELTEEIVQQLYDEYEDTIAVGIFGINKRTMVNFRHKDITGVFGYDTGSSEADAIISMGFICFCVGKGYRIPTNGT